MSIIIRLQNLPWAANSVDIRHYFAGLSIPEGGVHIVGGEKGDAFIAFSTDEDARQAMQKDGGKIKDMQIKLLLSSRAEMMRVIEQARQLNMGQGPTLIGASSTSTRSSSDSDRRRGRERSESPPRRRSRDKSPSRERRRSPDRRKRDRSRSRSPRRSRDVDRRNDRFKDRRFDDSSRYRDERRSRENSSSQDKKFPFSESDSVSRPTTDNLGVREPSEVDRRYDTTNTYYDAQKTKNYSYATAPTTQSLTKTISDASLSTFGIADYATLYPKPLASRSDNPEESHLPNHHRPILENDMAYNQRNPPLNATSHPFNKPGYEQMNIPGGVLPKLEEKNLQNSNLPPETYPKQRRTRFEPEFTNPPTTAPYFEPSITQEPKISLPTTRATTNDSYSHTSERIGPDFQYPRRDAWAHQPNETSNGGWVDKRPTLLEPPKTSRDQVQVVPMEIEDVSSPVPGINLEPKDDPYRPPTRMPFNARIEDRDSRINPNPLSTLHTLSVEVRGLPPDTREEDIVDLFRGIHLPPNNVRLPTTSRGLAVGQAFVRFLTMADFEEGLSRHRQFVRNCCVDIVACPNSAFDSAPKIIGDSTPAKPLPKLMPREEDLCVQLKGLPFSCKEEDIIGFFDGLGILDLYIHTGPDGRPSGLGFVEFGKREDFHASLAMNGKMIGHRYIDVTTSSREMMNASRVGAKRPEPFYDKPAPIARPLLPPNRGPPLCVALKNLPENVMNKNIADFFREAGVMLRAIHIMLRPDKAPSGDAYAELTGGQREMDIALSLNGKPLLGNRITINPITFEEMSNCLGRPSIPPQIPLLRAPHEDPRPRRPPPIRAEMPRPEVPPMQGNRPHMEPSFPPPRGEAFPPRMRGGPFPPRMRGTPPPRGMRPMRPPFNGPEGNRFPPRNRGPPPHSLDGPKDFGSPGCVVAINNLHFRAGLEELLDFFSNYTLNKDNIIRKYNEHGQTTGEARVAFQNPREAERAVRELNHKPIMGRPLSLTLI